MTYVDDIVNGIITITESEPKFTIVNVTTEESVSVLDMIKYAKNVTENDVRCVNIEDRNGQIYKEVIHSKRLQSLGGKWKTSFEEGIKESYDFYLSNNEKW